MIPKAVFKWECPHFYSNVLLECVVTFDLFQWHFHVFCTFPSIHFIDTSSFHFYDTWSVHPFHRHFLYKLQYFMVIYLNFWSCVWGVIKSISFAPWIYYIIIGHTCFSFGHPIKCGATTIGNCFQVTIWNTEALGSWNLNFTLIWPSFLSYIVFGCLDQVSRELGH